MGIVDRPDRPIRCMVRTRYHQKEMEELLIPEEGKNVRFEFGEPQEKPARGQSAVAYSGDYVIGGGIIA